MLLTGLLLLAAIGFTWMILAETERQFRGVLGRPYRQVVIEAMWEATRRAELLARIAEKREARLERLERRLEQGR